MLLNLPIGVVPEVRQGQDRKNQIDKFHGKIKIMYESGEHDFLVAADKWRLTQVICKLLDNAIKFTTEGMISINLEKKDSQAVVLSIKDTGSGIDSQVLPRLFSKFVAKSKIGGGTGLGLFIAKSIIEAHDGKIWAENNTNGRGATFSFSLPVLGKSISQKQYTTHKQ